MKTNRGTGKKNMDQHWIWGLLKVVLTVVVPILASAFFIEIHKRKRRRERLEILRDSHHPEEHLGRLDKYTTADTSNMAEGTLPKKKPRKQSFTSLRGYKDPHEGKYDNWEPQPNTIWTRDGGALVNMDNYEGEMLGIDLSSSVVLAPAIGVDGPSLGSSTELTVVIPETEINQFAFRVRGSKYAQGYNSGGFHLNPQFIEDL